MSKIRSIIFFIWSSLEDRRREWKYTKKISYTPIQRVIAFGWLFYTGTVLRLNKYESSSLFYRSMTSSSVETVDGLKSRCYVIIKIARKLPHPARRMVSRLINYRTLELVLAQAVSMQRELGDFQVNYSYTPPKMYRWEEFVIRGDIEIESSYVSGVGPKDVVKRKKIPAGGEAFSIEINQPEEPPFVFPNIKIPVNPVRRWRIRTKHIKILNEGVKVWNKYREDNPEENILLYSVKLENANLEGVNLNGADLRRANLKNAKLSRAFLDKADLQGAILEGAELLSASAQEANFNKSNIRGTNFYHSNLQKAIFRNVKCNEFTSFCYADLSETDFTGAQNLEMIAIAPPGQIPKLYKAKFDFNVMTRIKEINSTLLDKP